MTPFPLKDFDFVAAVGDVTLSSSGLVTPGGIDLDLDLDLDLSSSSVTTAYDSVAMPDFDADALKQAPGFTFRIKAVEKNRKDLAL